MGFKILWNNSKIFFTGFNLKILYFLLFFYFTAGTENNISEINQMDFIFIVLVWMYSFDYGLFNINVFVLFWITSSRRQSGSSYPFCMLVREIWCRWIKGTSLANSKHWVRVHLQSVGILPLYCTPLPEAMNTELSRHDCKHLERRVK